MPGAREIPEPVVGWRLEARRAVLLVHDMQRYFVRFLPAGRSPTVELIANVQRLLRAARAAGVPVIYTAQPGDMSRDERGLLHDFWGPGMSGAAEDRAVLDAVAPAAGECVITRFRYSAFARTDLAERLGERDQLVVCGVFAHIGCVATAADAFVRDVQPFLAGDALAGFSRADHLRALRWAASSCAVTASTAALTADLMHERAEAN